MGDGQQDVYTKLACTISMEIIAIYFVRLICNGLQWTERIMLRSVVAVVFDSLLTAIIDIDALQVQRVQIVYKSFWFFSLFFCSLHLNFIVGIASLIYLWFFCLFGWWRHDICPRSHQHTHTHTDTNDMRAKVIPYMRFISNLWSCWSLSLICFLNSASSYVN